MTLLLAGLCFGFTLATLLNTRLSRKKAPIKWFLDEVMDRPRHKAYVPKAKNEDDPDIFEWAKK